MNLPSTIESPPSEKTVEDKIIFAEVVLNLPLKGSFTYAVPPQFHSTIQPGFRVFVPFGRRKLTGYVVSLSDSHDKAFTIKNIDDVLDTGPVLSPEILSLTRWVADYYQSSWGEAVKTALPAGLEDESRETLTLSPEGTDALNEGTLKESWSLILKTVQQRGQATPGQLRRFLKNKFSAYALARLKQTGCLESQIAIKRSFVGYQYEKLARAVTPLPDLDKVDQLLGRSPKQKAVYALLLEGEQTLKTLAEKIPTYAPAFKKLREKGLAETATLKIHRDFKPEDSDASWTPDAHLPFTPDQKLAYKELDHALTLGEFKTYLLHGVTGSGKTELYIRSIQKRLN